MPVTPICDRCDEPGVGYNEDGDFLCEDCMFEEFVEATTPRGDLPHETDNQ